MIDIPKGFWAQFARNIGKALGMLCAWAILAALPYGVEHYTGLHRGWVLLSMFVLLALAGCADAARIQTKHAAQVRGE